MANFSEYDMVETMFFTNRLRNLFLAFLIAFSGVNAHLRASEDPSPGQVAIYISQLLERGHLTRHPFNGNISRALLDTYIESLDYSRMFFTQEDIEMLRKNYSDELHEYILLGNPKPAYEIHDLYKQRVQERVSYVKSLLKKEFTFDSNRTVELDRSKASWPANKAEAEDLWLDRIESELLQQKLNEHATRPGRELVLKRYNQLLRNVNEQTEQDIVYDFLSALARAYDPHSEYLDPDALENFEISMRLSLVGIGAVLRSDEGYARIVELVPGGPAEQSGKLSVNDRIAAVAQGEEEFVDVVDMRLDDVVKLIRGKKNTVVRLQTIPDNAVDPAQRDVVKIVRDKVELKQQEAKAEVIERIGHDGKQERLGWITLPSFYADMGKARAKDSKSTTRDVAILLERLKKEKIKGLVVDLRANGGGSLEEAVNLTGLFIKDGPVVQTKDSNGNVIESRDRDSRIAYDGPLVVLTSRLSASASEIFAGALQDYNRAVIVGDESTFGKGTVQTMLPLGNLMTPMGGEAPNAGALKLTIQQFYLPSGQSTQLRGVLSDIVLPSLTDQPKIGESALDSPLPYDEVAALDIDYFSKTPLFIDELRSRSQERVSRSREFRYIMEDIDRLARRVAQNSITVNEEKRRKEIVEAEARTERREEERKNAKSPKPLIYSITLDNVELPELQKASANSKPVIPVLPDEDMDDPDKEEKEIVDIEKTEALNILSDLVDLLDAPRTASVDKSDAVKVP